MEKVKSDWEKLPERVKPEKEVKAEKFEKPEKPEFEKPPVPGKGTKEAEVPSQGGGPLAIDRETLLRHAQALENLGRDLRPIGARGRP